MTFLAATAATTASIKIAGLRRTVRHHFSINPATMYKLKY